MPSTTCSTLHGIGRQTANGPEAQAKRAIKARKNALAQHAWKTSDQPAWLTQESLRANNSAPAREAFQGCHSIFPRSLKWYRVRPDLPRAQSESSTMEKTRSGLVLCES